MHRLLACCAIFIGLSTPYQVLAEGEPPKLELSDETKPVEKEEAEPVSKKEIQPQTEAPAEVEAAEPPAEAETPEAPAEAEKSLSQSGSSSFILSKATLDIKNTNAKDPKGYGFTSEFWFSLPTPYLSLVIQPSLYYLSRSEEILTEVDPPKREKVTIPTIAVDFFDMLTAGPTIKRSAIAIRPFVGLGYSLGMSLSAYESGSAAYIVRDIIHHFDVGTGMQVSLSDRIRILLLYATAQTLQSSTNIQSGEYDQSYSDSGGDWSFLILNADLMLTERFGLTLRYQADKLRGRSKGIKDTMLKSYIGFGINFHK